MGPTRGTAAVWSGMSRSTWYPRHRGTGVFLGLGPRLRFVPALGACGQGAVHPWPRRAQRGGGRAFPHPWKLLAEAAPRPPREGGGGGGETPRGRGAAEGRPPGVCRGTPEKGAGGGGGPPWESGAAEGTPGVRTPLCRPRCCRAPSQLAAARPGGQRGALGASPAPPVPRSHGEGSAGQGEGSSGRETGRGAARRGTAWSPHRPSPGAAGTPPPTPATRPGTAPAAPSWRGGGGTRSAAAGGGASPHRGRRATCAPDVIAPGWARRRGGGARYPPPRPALRRWVPSGAAHRPHRAPAPRPRPCVRWQSPKRSVGMGWGEIEPEPAPAVWCWRSRRAAGTVPSGRPPG